MSDFHPDDTFLRASAYLDGELDAAETARAEADPAVMAEVDLIRALQSELRDVEPFDPRARERAINAALAEFDELTAADVVPFRPRPSYTRWLGVAAAVVGVGLLGVIVATAGSGGDDDDAAEIAFESSAQDLDDAQAQRSSLEAPAPAAEAVESGDTAAVLSAGGDAADAPEATVAAEATMAPAATEAPAATALAADASAESTTSAGAPPFDPNVPIPDEITLGIVGRQLIASQSSPQVDDESVRSTIETACDDDAEQPRTILAEGSYLRDGAAIPILIAVDASNDKIVAIDPESCNVVAVEP
jgi:hypothetical protein